MAKRVNRLRSMTSLADTPFASTGLTQAVESSPIGCKVGGDMTYSNAFTCIPSQLPFRPARKTPKPFIQGVQHALVTGPPGEEIFTDTYGRVKVQFYWDREGKNDANSSCWLRAGKPSGTWPKSSAPKESDRFRAPDSATRVRRFLTT
jgi:uncharacterized protein involved in type VI secretion and phage assembly